MGMPVPRLTLIPYTTLFRSKQGERAPGHANGLAGCGAGRMQQVRICGARPALFLDQLHQPALDRGKHRTQFVPALDRKSTRLNSSHVKISYAVFCLKKKISQ